MGKEDAQEQTIEKDAAVFAARLAAHELTGKGPPNIATEVMHCDTARTGDAPYQPRGGIAEGLQVGQTGWLRTVALCGSSPPESVVGTLVVVDGLPAAQAGAHRRTGACRQAHHLLGHHSVHLFVGVVVQADFPVHKLDPDAEAVPP